MSFEDILQEACAELKLDQHTKTIEKKKDAHTYAEKIVANFKDKPFVVKNGYMFLDGVDFCFYQNGDDVDFAISGHISKGDKLKISTAIDKALELCALCEYKMRRAKSKSGGNQAGL